VRRHPGTAHVGAEPMSRMRRRHGGAGPVPRWESESWNPLHSSTSPDDSWTTTNVGEAVPGVPTPLSWSLWSYVLDSALRAGAWSIGALDDAERRVPSLISQRHVRIFYGRPALRVQFLAEVGDRMPGTTGREVVRDLFGRVPEGLTFAP